MANVRLRWTPPTPGANQNPLKHFLIEARTSPQLPWAAINTVQAGINELLLNDVAAGTWEYQNTVVDSADQKSTAVQTSVTVGAPVKDPPSPVTGFTATVE